MQLSKSPSNDKKAAQESGKAPAPKSGNGPDSASQSAQRPRLSYAEQRERDKAIKRARKKVEEAEAEVARHEAEIKALEARLSEGEATQELYEQHAALTKQLENAMSLWELAVIDSEELSSRR